MVWVLIFYELPKVATHSPVRRKLRVCVCINADDIGRYEANAD